MSYYHGLISSRKANSILVSKGNGSFLIRDSQSQPGSFVLTAKYVTLQLLLLLCSGDNDSVIKLACTVMYSERVR